jgi:hypothetical protein
MTEVCKQPTQRCARMLQLACHGVEFGNDAICRDTEGAREGGRELVKLHSSVVPSSLSLTVTLKMGCRALRRAAVPERT